MNTPEENAMAPENIWNVAQSEEEKFLASLPPPPLQSPYLTASEKQAAGATVGTILRALFIVFCLMSLPVIFLVGTFATALAVCGISGCSGGGFGVSGSPIATVILSVLTGMVMMGVLAAALVAAKVGKPRKKTVVVLLVPLYLVLSLLTSQLILAAAGADWRGCPASGSQSHCPDGWWDVNSNK